MTSLFVHRLRHNRRLRLLWITVIVITVVSIGAARLVWSAILRGETPLERAERLSDAGDFADAETAYWKALGPSPIDMEALIGLIDNEANLTKISELHAHMGGDAMFSVRAVGDHAIVERLEQPDVDPVTRTLGLFWMMVKLGAGKPDTREVAALADLPKPPPWANHLLGEAALDRGDISEAARRFEREGLSFPDEAQSDLATALEIWSRHDDWSEVRKRIADPRYRSVVGPSIELDLAIHDHDWPKVLLWIWPAGYEGVGPWPIALALLAGALWFSIGSKMGRIEDRVPGRLLLYIAAFVLGVLSVYPTLVTIVLEQQLLHLTQVGEPIRDAVFFVFGVGLREELWKLLLFLPLLPILKRRGSRVEALTCGAFVGLGFAAEENIGYFGHYALSGAIERFLTANFLHMALTALVCVSVYDGDRAREGSIGHFHVAFPLAVLVHGAYDFFLSSRQMAGGALVAMGLFILLSHRFLHEVVFMLSQEERDGVLRRFVISLFVLSGISYVYATTWVGPAMAMGEIAVGFLGVIILVVMFVRELA